MEVQRREALLLSGRSSLRRMPLVTTAHAGQNCAGFGSPLGPLQLRWPQHLVIFSGGNRRSVRLRLLNKNVLFCALPPDHAHLDSNPQRLRRARLLSAAVSQRLPAALSRAFWSDRGILVYYLTML